MNQPIQSLTDFLTSNTSAKGIKTTISQAGQSPDLSEVEAALKGFDSYLKDAAEQNTSADGSASEDNQNLVIDTSLMGNAGLAGGKLGDPDGNILPLNADMSSSANYTTAAENLVADLSLTSNQPSSDLIADGHANAASATNTEIGTESAYGFFDSPLYKTMIGAGQNSDADVKLTADQLTRQKSSDQAVLQTSTLIGTKETIAGVNLNQAAINGALNTTITSTAINQHRLNPASSSKLQPSGAIHNSQDNLAALTQAGLSPQRAIVSGATSSMESLQNPALLMENVISTSASVVGQNATHATAASFPDGIVDIANVKDTSLSTLNNGSKLLDASHQNLRMKMDTPVMQEGWNREFSMKIHSLAASGGQSASLQLNPSELGSIEISMSTEGDKAKVHFMVQTTGAREALENSLPRLREFLAESGMTLADTGVEDQSAQSGLADQQEQSQAHGNANATEESELSNSETDLAKPGTQSINGQIEQVVDYYI